MSYELYLDPQSQSSTLGQHLHGFNFLFYKYVKITLFWSKNFKKNFNGFSDGLLKKLKRI